MLNNFRTINEEQVKQISESIGLSNQQSFVRLLNPPASRIDTALLYIKNGLSVIPVKQDKQPAISWKPFQTRLPQANEITAWWNQNNYSIAVICGNVSNNLEVIDFDEKYNIETISLLERWQQLVEKESPGLVSRLTIQQTMNKGFHVCYRCKKIDGNQKLALREATQEEQIKDSNVKTLTLIETRGQGGYVMCYPSPGYSLCNGDLISIPDITSDEREVLLSCAKSLNQFIDEKNIVREKRNTSKMKRPGDFFNEQADHKQLLEKHGWKYLGEDEKNENWCRPGKSQGVSATLLKEKKYFYVFSSNTPSLEANKAYDLFSLYTNLEHNGNYSESAKSLVLLGYGTLEQTGNKIVLVENYLNEHYEFRTNIITQRIEYRKKITGGFVQVTDKELNSIFRELHHNDLPVTIEALRHILESDYSESYDPFQEYFENLPTWNGTYDYIEELSNTVTLKEPQDKPAWQQCLQRWIIGQVACAINPEATNHTAIIFVGEQQGVGKTTWLNKLIPPPLDKYKFVGTINPENKDTSIYLSETMLINLDELETLRKAEIGALKTIMTMSAIKVRRPYAHYPIDMTRRTSFVGSINSTEFLNDPTGSRRFLTFEVDAINYNHSIDMNNVYAQAYSLYKAGTQYWFSGQEIAGINERNKKHSIQSYEQELLNQYFEPGDVTKNIGIWNSSTEVANMVHDIVADFRVDNKSVRNIGIALVAENYPSKKTQGIKQYYLKVSR